MTISVRDTGARRRAVSIRVRTGSGLVPVNRVSFRTDTGVVRVYNRAMQISATPSGVSGYGGQRTGPVYTNTTSVSVSGGSPPYQHSWSVGGGAFALNPASSSTAFVGSPPINGTIDTAAVDTVTDASGLTATVEVPVYIERVSYA